MIERTTAMLLRSSLHRRLPRVPLRRFSKVMVEKVVYKIWLSHQPTQWTTVENAQIMEDDHEFPKRPTSDPTHHFCGPVGHSQRICHDRLLAPDLAPGAGQRCLRCMAPPALASATSGDNTIESWMDGPIHPSIHLRARPASSSSLWANELTLSLRFRSGLSVLLVTALAGGSFR